MRIALIALLLALAAPLLGAQPVPELPPRVVAPTDQAQYRRFVLDNGLRVLLVSDARLNKSAAALVVRVGQIDDPRDSEGLAHFLEHMLFLGTEKYPDEGEYTRFMRSNGGSKNAYTSSDHTNYHFDVRHEALPEALDRFSQFFISPRFNPEFVGREVNAVHNEAMRHVQNDGRRMTSVMRELYDPASGESKFSTGNKDTLARATPQAVRAFYEQHYSADRMALAITGRASLDELEKLAREKFAAIARRNTVATVHAPTFLPRKPALRMARVEPVKELRQLQMEFVMPPTRPMFASRSDRLLTELLSHPGPGGLLAALKAEGLVNNLGADLWERTPQYGSLWISADLTPAGERAVQTVMQRIFAWVDFLRRSPFPREFYDDRARIGALTETYGDRGEGMGLATRLANQALFYPLEVAERANTAWGRPDEAAWRRLLDAIVPENMIAALAARGVPTDRKERIYGVAYSYQEDAGAAFEALRKPAAVASFALPGKNRFMPASTALLPERAQRLIDEPGLALHYSPDTSFERPQTALLMRLVPVRDMATAPTEALLDLWQRALQDALEADVNEARAAGVQVSVDAGLEGLRVTVTGYGDSPARVARHLAPRLRDFQVAPDRFNDLREQVVRSLSSYSQTEAYSLAIDRREAMQREFRNFPSQLLPHARSATWPQVQQLGQRYLARGKLEMLFHGHIAPEEAVATARAVASALEVRAAAPADLVRRRHLVMRPGEHLVDSGTVQGVNSAWAAAYLFDGDSPELRATSAAIATFISSPFYTELRTRQQLGYIVGAGLAASVRERSLSFLIQSSTHASPDLRQRAETVIQGLPAALEAVTDAEWTTLKAGVRAQLEARPKSITERAERLFTAAYSFEGEWDRTQSTLAALESLQKPQAVALLKQVLDPARAMRRTVMLDPASRAPVPPVTPSFADLDGWKKDRTFR